MNEYAYKKLEEAVRNNEIDLFFEANPKYLISDSGPRGVEFNIYFDAMANAATKYIINHPEDSDLVRESIINVLRKGKIGYVMNIMEMTAYQLRYTNNTGFLSEDILKELKNQITILRSQFEKQEMDRYTKLNDLAVRSSGRGFM